jgi:hypothetical protein
MALTAEQEARRKASFKATVAVTNHKPARGGTATGAGWRALVVKNSPPPLPAGSSRSLKKLRKEEVEARLKQILWHIANDPKEPSPNRIVASDKLLDRVVGKARQTIDSTIGGDFLSLVMAAHQKKPPE